MNENPSLDPVIEHFYMNRFQEDARLTRSRHGQLEFLRVQELVRRHLPSAPARILDIGGATGIHARWLAADGYEVHLIDPVPSHVDYAGRLDGVTAAIGDARSLEEPDAGADAVLLFGPLYHLIERAERLQALAEARRVVRPGGVVLAAAISRYAGLLEYSGLGLLNSENDREFLDVLETGVHKDDPNGFTNAYMHGYEEFRSELEAPRFADVTVYGVEGPSAAALDNAPESRADAVLASAAHCARLLERDPAMIASSAHFLGIGLVG